MLVEFNLDCGMLFNCGGKLSWVGEVCKVIIMVVVEMVEELCIIIGIEELDWVLGGGLVEGLVVLIGGDLGIGKLIILL